MLNNVQLAAIVSVNGVYVISEKCELVDLVSFIAFTPLFNYAFEAAWHYFATFKIPDMQIRDYGFSYLVQAGCGQDFRHVALEAFGV